MKAAAINDCIDRSLVLTNEDHTVYRDVVHKSVVAARAELAAIKYENAVMREALARVASWEGFPGSPRSYMPEVLSALEMTKVDEDA